MKKKIAGKVGMMTGQVWNILPMPRSWPPDIQRPASVPSPAWLTMTAASKEMGIKGIAEKPRPPKAKAKSSNPHGPSPTRITVNAARSAKSTQSTQHVVRTALCAPVKPTTTDMTRAPRTPQNVVTTPKMEASSALYPKGPTSCAARVLEVLKDPMLQLKDRIRHHLGESTEPAAGLAGGTGALVP